MSGPALLLCTASGFNSSPLLLWNPLSAFGQRDPPPPTTRAADEGQTFQKRWESVHEANHSWFVPDGTPHHGAVEEPQPAPRRFDDAAGDETRRDDGGGCAELSQLLRNASNGGPRGLAVVTTRRLVP